MMVLVDTPVWSLALRRKPGDLNAREQALTRALAELVREGRAQIVAGTLNLTPFTWKFAQLINAGLGQHATFLVTWPGRRPLFLMDNILSTNGIASVRTSTGPALGSDHRPLIADIAFAK